jgi:hypothetical protein
MKKELLKLIDYWRSRKVVKHLHPTFQRSFVASICPDYRDGIADTLEECVRDLEDLLANQGVAVDSESDAVCDCGAKMEQIKPQKWQCPHCH